MDEHKYKHQCKRMIQPCVQHTNKQGHYYACSLYKNISRIIPRGCKHATLHANHLHKMHIIQTIVSGSLLRYATLHALYKNKIKNANNAIYRTVICACIHALIHSNNIEAVRVVWIAAFCT